MLSRIGSVCGKPIHYDKCTLSKMKLGFTRILVEMDSFGQFPDTIELQDENGVVFNQKVVYEWKHAVYSSYKKFAHSK